MESTPYTMITYLKESPEQYIIVFDIFYEDNLSETNLISQWVRELNKWHKKKYGLECPYKIEYHDDEIIIKYTNQFLIFTFTITKKLVVLDNTVIKATVPGYNARAIVQKMNFVINPKNNEDYEMLKILTKNVCRVIIRENKKYNDEYNEEQQNLCAIEYAMDHC
jgi:hypothetical protein